MNLVVIVGRLRLGEYMNELERFFRYRQGLIDQYVKGDLTKAEYLDECYDAVVGCGFGPFRRIDTAEKGLFNYQYYNALAKRMNRLLGREYLAAEQKQELLARADGYYEKKDRATLSILRLLEYRNMTAYYVKVRSKTLNGRLYEIVLFEYNMILHSTNAGILQTLCEEGVFVEEKRASLIDGYVNQKY